MFDKIDILQHMKTNAQRLNRIFKKCCDTIEREGVMTETISDRGHAMYKAHPLINTAVAIFKEIGSPVDEESKIEQLFAEASADN